MRVNVYKDDKTETFKVSFCLVLLVSFCTREGIKKYENTVLCLSFSIFAIFAVLLNSV